MEILFPEDYVPISFKELFEPRSTYSQNKMQTGFAARAPQRTFHSISNIFRSSVDSLLIVKIARILYAVHPKSWN